LAGWKLARIESNTSCGVESMCSLLAAWATPIQIIEATALIAMNK
jgi:hypothetical protein